MTTEYFKDIRFPTDIAYGVSGGPEFSTDIVTTVSGKEYRNINWQRSRARYNISQGIKTKQQFIQLLGFFRNCKGRAYGFRFKDHSDYVATNELIGVGDGKTTIFQLIKRYGNDIRIITKPVKNTVNVRLDGKYAFPEINHLSGEVIFSTPPFQGQQIYANFEFDVPVRFDTDFFDGSIDDYNSYSWQDINLIELK